MPSWIEVPQVDYYKLESRADNAEAKVATLESQLADAKRNEEELKAKLAIWEGGIQGDALKALNEAPDLKAKLHTLEAAVRAVRDGDEGLGGDDRGHGLQAAGQALHTGAGGGGVIYLTIEEFRHEVKNPGDWQDLEALSSALFTRLEVAEARLADLRAAVNTARERILSPLDEYPDKSGTIDALLALVPEAGS